MANSMYVTSCTSTDSWLIAGFYIPARLPHYSCTFMWVWLVSYPDSPSTLQEGPGNETRVQHIINVCVRVQKRLLTPHHQLKGWEPEWPNPQMLSWSLLAWEYSQNAFQTLLKIYKFQNFWEYVIAIFPQFMQFPLLDFGLVHSGSQPFNSHIGLVLWWKEFVALPPSPPPLHSLPSPPVPLLPSSGTPWIPRHLQTYSTPGPDHHTHWQLAGWPPSSKKGIWQPSVYVAVHPQHCVRKLLGCWTGCMETGYLPQNTSDIKT